VRESAIVGIPDRRLGHVIGAAITLRLGVELDPSDLKDWCAERMPRYMVPARIVIVTELPKLRSMKVDRGAVLAMLT